MCTLYEKTPRMKEMQNLRPLFIRVQVCVRAPVYMTIHELGCAALN